MICLLIIISLVYPEKSKPPTQRQSGRVRKYSILKGLSIIKTPTLSESQGRLDSNKKNYLYVYMAWLSYYFRSASGDPIQNK